MILYHTTPKQNLWSIRAHGLDPGFARGKRKGIWLHTASKTHWAILHTMKRYRTDEIVVLKVKVSRRVLTRRWRGLWTCHEIITDIIDITGAEQFASNDERG